MSGSPRLLFVHAHPDDEALLTGGSLALHAAAGCTVDVLTCTLGEEGEVIGERWAGLTAGRADQLGGYRIGELTAALAAVGVDRPEFLGGAGTFRDSGMAGSSAARDPRALGNAGEAPTALLASVLVRRRPDVVVGYDPAGGYGHPDHVRVFEITEEAVRRAAAGETECGESWDTPALYWTINPRSVVEAARRVLPDFPGYTRPGEGELAAAADDLVDVVVTLDDAALAAKEDALAAHATQITLLGRSAAGAGAFALSDRRVQPVLRTESYHLSRRGAGFVAPPPGRLA